MSPLIHSIDITFHIALLNAFHISLFVHDSLPLTSWSFLSDWEFPSSIPLIRLPSAFPVFPGPIRSAIVTRVGVVHGKTKLWFKNPSPLCYVNHPAIHNQPVGITAPWYSCVFRLLGLDGGLGSRRDSSRSSTRVLLTRQYGTQYDSSRQRTWIFS